MPSYQGGKVRLGRRIHKVISDLEHDYYNGKKKTYFEPFVGMGGVLIHFAKENNRKLVACDANADIILMWQSLQNGWTPPTKCTKEYYHILKNANEHSAERGFIGTVCAWGGVFFSTYRIDYVNRDIMTEGCNSLMKMKNDMDNVLFLDASSYEKFEPTDFTIYADPPYKNNALANPLFKKFDHERFWDKMREWSKNNLVIISERVAPEDFVKIWTKESITTTRSFTKRYDDNLYIHKDIYDIYKWSL